MEDIEKFNMKVMKWIAWVTIVVTIISLTSAFVSAFEFDNSLTDYNSETQTITYENCFGLCDEIASVTLNTEIHKLVTPTSTHFAEFTINSKVLYDEGWYDNIKLYTKSNPYTEKLGDEIKSPKIIFKYYDADYVWYENISLWDCEDKINKVKCVEDSKLVEHIGDWVEFNPNEKILTKDEILKIRLYYPDAVGGQTYEWIPQFFNTREVTEWADFTSYTLYESQTKDDTDEYSPSYRAGAYADADWVCQNFTIGANGTNSAFTLRGASIKIGGDASVVLKIGTYIVNSTGTKEPCIQDGTPATPLTCANGIIAMNKSTLLVQDATVRIINITLNASDGTSVAPVLNDTGQYWLCLNSSNTETDQPHIRTQKTSPSYSGGERWLYDSYGSGKWENYSWGGGGFAWYSDIWFKIWGDAFDSPPVVTLNFPENNTNFSITQVNFNCSATDDTGILELALYIDGVYNKSVHNDTANDVLVTLNETITNFQDGGYNWTCLATDTSANQNRAGNNSFWIDTTAPSLVLNLPSLLNYTNSTFDGFNQTLNYTVTDAGVGIDDCWYNTSDDATTHLFTCNSATANVSFTSVGNKTIYYYANDTLNNVNYGSKNIFLYLYNYTQDVDNPITVETETVVFNLTVEMNDITSVDAFFYLNNSKYSPTTTTSGSNNYYFTKSFTIPAYYGNFTGKNYTWYWNYTIHNHVAEANTSLENLSVYSGGITNCSLYGTPIMNFTLRDEDENTIISLADRTSEVNLDVLIYKGGSTWNYSRNYVNWTNFTLCVPKGLITAGGYAMNLTLDYNANESEYVTEFWNLQNYSVKTPMKNVSLMDLISSKSTSFLTSYTDENGLLQNGYIISLLRKYIDEGIFREVENGITDNNGETILHLIEEDVIYKFNVSLNGIQKYLTSEYKVYCEAGETCSIELDESSEMDTFPHDWDNLPEGTYTLTSNVSTRKIIFTFNTNSSATHNLSIYLATNNQTEADTLIVNNSTTGSSGNIVVEVPQSYGNKTYYAVVYRNNTWITSQFINLKEKGFNYFGVTGLLMSALLILALSLMAISLGLGVIIFGIIGIVLAMILQLLDLNWLIIVYAVCGGALIVAKMIFQRRREA